MSIYRNLANAYWGLNDLPQATVTYREALAALADLNSLDAHARSYGDLSRDYHAAGDLERARHYGARALGIYEAAHNLDTAAQLQLNLAEILGGQQEWDEAARAARPRPEVPGPDRQPALASQVAEQYALLELGRGQPKQAAAHVEQALALGGEDAAAPAGDAQARRQAGRARARALRAAGLVAERQGQRKQADQYFQQALTLVEGSEHAETAHEIAFTYAEILDARGDHKQAATYYRTAARAGQRQHHHG